MSFSKYLNVNPSFQYTPSIPGMDLGNFGNIYKPGNTPKHGPIPSWLPGFGGAGGMLDPDTWRVLSGQDAKGEPKNDDWFKKIAKGELEDFNPGEKEESMADIFGRYIGDTTLKDHTNQMADIGKEAMGIKYGLDTAQKAMQQIAANNVFTGQQILDSSNKYGAGVMALAGKQQPAFNTQFRGMTPLKYSFFMG